MLSDLKETSNEIRRLIVEKAYACGQPAHLGGALSMVDLLTVLYQTTLKFKPDDPEFKDRDIFILSKGHTVLGYFATLFHFKYFSKAIFDTFQTNGSQLIAHPIKNLSYGIESSNGSLGQGLSYGSGMALGYKKRKMNNKVFVMMGDGECNEGAVWEAAQLSAELSLRNLIVIVDQNGLRNDGATSYKEGMSLDGMWAAFGWHTLLIDGHNHVEILNAFKLALAEPTKPTVIIANTIKGKGFSFMEANNDWHHNRITQSVYQKCMAEIEGNHNED